jgi:hypothetical protein
MTLELKGRGDYTVLYYNNVYAGKHKRLTAVRFIDRAGILLLYSTYRLDVTCNCHCGLPYARPHHHAKLLTLGFSGTQHNCNYTNPHTALEVNPDRVNSTKFTAQPKFSGLHEIRSQYKSSSTAIIMVLAVLQPPLKIW